MLLKIRPNPRRAPLAITLAVAVALLAACGGGYGGASKDRGGVSAPSVRVETENAGVAFASAPADEAGGLWDEMLPDDDPALRTRETKIADAPPPAAEPAQDPGPSGEEGSSVDPDPDAEPSGSAERLAPPAQRLIIYTGMFNVFVIDIEGAIDRAIERAQSIGGWMKASTSESITLRVPVEDFESFVAWIESDLGRLTSRHVEGVDVTEEFYDLEIRLQNALSLRARYQDLLERAETVEDTLKIEAELARVTGEIEQIKGRLRFLRQHSAFSTITISFYREAERLPQNQTNGLPFRWLRSYRIDRVYKR